MATVMMTAVKIYSQHRFRRCLAVVGVSLLTGMFLVGCSNDTAPRDELQVVANPVAATAAASPPRNSEPVGIRVALPTPSAITAVVSEPSSRTLAVAIQEPPTVLLYDLSNVAATPRSLPIPAPAASLTAAPGRILASLPNHGTVLTISVPNGSVSDLPVSGEPVAARVTGDSVAVAVRDRKAIDVHRPDGSVSTIGGQLYSADDVLTADNNVVVVDRLRTAIFSVDVAAGRINEGLRAGEGAAQAATDSFGRVFVTDTRGGSLIAFSTDPLLLRQRYPVPGGIYGIAYDPTRHLMWVTLTERNEVVGYDIRGGEPVEKHRFASVQQPNSITVDEHTSHVIVGSATSEGLQVINP